MKLFCSIILLLTIYPWKMNTREQHLKENNNLKQISTDSSNLFWFIQVTDIHISRFSGFDRAPDLKKFCQTHVVTIKPDFVIVTGDLTDAKLPDKIRSKQSIEEWKMYQNTVKSCKDSYDTTWLDIKGNHDAFDVPGDFDKRNLFRRFSAQGWRHPSSYSYTHVKPYGNYSIIAMDATPNPGPRRPFNFVGVMNQERKDVIKKLSEETKSSNLSVWFGHYTTSLIVDESGDNIRDLMKNAAYYLCGHLHTLGGLVTKMYTKHGTGTIELELGDWRDNRLYRILAVDHDLLSFTDVKYGEWPVVLITNPKDAQFISPKEHSSKMLNSTHIRILAFSTAKIQSVDVFINDKWIGLAHHVEGPLYVLPWNPTAYSHGLHTIKVTVQDSMNMMKTAEQSFSLDGSELSFPLRARFVLMIDVCKLGYVIFWTLVVIYIGLLILLRNFDNIHTIFIKGSNTVTSMIGNFINIWLLRVWLVTKVKSLYLLLIAFTLYVGLGPWFIADVIEDDIGIMFIWGLYVKGTFLPGSLTYIYGIFHIVTFNIPLLLITGYIIHYTREMSKKHHIPQFHKLRHVYIPFLCLMLFNGFVTIREFPTAYGTKAMVLGPVRTGSIFLAFIFYYIAQKNALSIPALHKLDKN